MAGRSTFRLSKLAAPAVMMLAFWGLGIMLAPTVHPFFLSNFGYIGTAIGVGMDLYTVLPRERKHIGRKLAQFLVGGCMLGLLARENMQIEGFFFYLLAGFMGGAVMHYLVAKIIGPLLFGRRQPDSQPRRMPGAVDGAAPGFRLGDGARRGPGWAFSMGDVTAARA